MAIYSTNRPLTKISRPPKLNAHQNAHQRVLEPKAFQIFSLFLSFIFFVNANRSRPPPPPAVAPPEEAGGPTAGPGLQEEAPGEDLRRGAPTGLGEVPRVQRARRVRHAQPAGDGRKTPRITSATIQAAPIVDLRKPAGTIHSSQFPTTGR